MSTRRLVAMIVIFGGASMAWAVLGASMWERTADLDESLSAEVASLIGPDVLAQTAPYWAPAADASGRDERAVPPDASEITVQITHEDRYKGLLWYNMTQVAFEGKYTLAPAAGGAAGAADGVFIFRLPEGINRHDGLTVTVDDEPYALAQAEKQSGDLAIPVSRDTQHTVTVAFSTQGQDMWLYLPGAVSAVMNDDGDDDLRHRGHELDPDAPRRLRANRDRVPVSHDRSELKNFSMTVTMNFTDVDYPKGTQSPKQTETVDGGFAATWRYDSLVTNQAMGVVMPKRTNAGPIAARMSFFAPVSLLFFFTVIFGVVVLKKIPLHPMHYLFIAAGFFAFHILLAYLADQVNIHAAFWICAAVSVFLVVSYMRAVVGMKFAVTYVAVAQMVYLVGFSYAFFWVGKTGLAVTIGAIATLFVLMQATGKLDWAQVFNRNAPAAAPTDPGKGTRRAQRADGPPTPPPITPPPGTPLTT